ncbi:MULTISPECIES: FtsQ-type POTRA domain-containing protein [unclassified Microbacterium]|uniref:FtsQ-type POTRA domain-containing protein n=1 Tax=unclassified Microbacterium TaxID=2609290 RepID=UPI003863CE54
MRRPSPLPSTPGGAPPRAPRPTPAAPREAEKPPASSVRSTAADETVPLDPLEEANASHASFAAYLRTDAGAPPAEAPPAADETGDARSADRAEERAIGIRDVWAAARARRRALRREVRRFTARQRRRRNALLISVGAVLAVALGAVGLAYSPLFAVDRITVVGTDRLDPDAVADALSSQRGTPLALVDSSAVKEALVGFPLVETYSLEARPPQELIVRIVERTPIGSLSSKAGHTLVDAAGVALSTTKDAPKGFPTLEIDGGAGSRAFLAAGSVYRSLPDDLRARVTAMSATTPNDVTLSIDGADVLWGGTDNPVEKAAVLRAAMIASPPEDVEMYDISSTDAAVIR